MTENLPVYAIDQCCRILQQRHPRFFRRPVAFSLIACETGRYQVLRRSISSTRSRQDVIDRQIKRIPFDSAVLATISIAGKNTSALARRAALPAANVDVVRQTNYAWSRKLEVLRSKN